MKNLKNLKNEIYAYKQELDAVEDKKRLYDEEMDRQIHRIREEMNNRLIILYSEVGVEIGGWL